MIICVSLQVLYGLRADHEAQLHGDSLERSALERVLEEEGERERRRVGEAQARLARVQAERANLRTLEQAGTRREWHEAHREGQREEVGSVYSGLKDTPEIRTPLYEGHFAMSQICCKFTT